MVAIYQYTSVNYRSNHFSRDTRNSGLVGVGGVQVAAKSPTTSSFTIMLKELVLA